MSQGIKKIKCTGGRIYKNLTTAGSLAIPADEAILLAVDQWEEGTSQADKKKNIRWRRETPDQKIVIRELVVAPTRSYGLTIQKAFCGSYAFYIEAAIEGLKNGKTAGVYIHGHCPAKIVNSKWSTQPDGLSIKNKNNGQTISYGDPVYLQLNTEGLNGNKLIVEIYNRQSFREDKLIHVYNNVAVVDGDVNLKIDNTFTWMARINYIQEIENFYVKVKDQADGSGAYIQDDKSQILHAVYLNIKREISSKNSKAPTNITPTKVYNPDANAERYEPCKFDAIKITQTDTKDGKPQKKEVVVFDRGKKLNHVSHPQEPISRTIHFEFDSVNIDTEGVKTLNNVLSFLLQHEHSTIKLDGYACVIGTMDYNRALSQKRSDVVKTFFAKGKLDPQRIISIGNGEINPTDDKKGRDNIKYKNEKEYKDSRRVDISFNFLGHDADTIIYETTAPSVSTKKDIVIDISNFDTKDCFRDKDKHVKQVTVLNIGQMLDTGDKPETFAATSFNYKIYSDLSKFNIAPIQYIWPMGTTPNKIYFNVHSCRYYSNKKNNTFLINVYPDIKWTLDFTLNLTNELSVKWQNLSPEQQKEFQEKSGKIGAERRWKQKDASFDFSLKAKWDNDSRSKELKYQYETKFKKLYDVFSSIGAVADGITSKTKGTFRKISPKGIPVSFVVKPPNLKLSGNWSLESPQLNDSIVGTNVALELKADPLIGLEITIDLLGAVVFAGAAIIGASPGVTELYQEIQSQLKSGINVGNDDIGFKSNVDIYMDLVLTGTISVDSDFDFNTAGRLSDSKLKIEGSSKLKVELKGGVKIKGELLLIVVKAKAYFEASASADASVTFGHTVNYDNVKGLYYRPVLGFDGLNAKYTVSVSIGLAMKIAKDKSKVTENEDGKWDIAKGDFKNVIPPFDVVKELEKYFGISADIPLITYKDIN